MDIKAYLSRKKDIVDKALEKLAPPAKTFPTSVHEAMRYSLFAGGKRVRPILAIAAAEALGAKTADLLPIAGSLELIHTYSLIHDDLPAMDDDDFRRGRPTCHKVYGEALAILAGDALLTQAFILLSGEPPAPGIAAPARLRVINEIAQAAGSRGMVGGQVVDILQEDREVDLATLLYLHTHKTGSLIRACLRVGGIISSAGSEQMEALTRYGDRIGLAFQIVDDILDVEGSLEALGKRAGSDLRKKKATFPGLLGLEESRQRARSLVREAKHALSIFGDRGAALGAIADYVVARRR